MITTLEALERIAVALPSIASPPALGRYAQAIRVAGVDLWPVSGRGGGKAAAPILLHHSANLPMALAGGSPAEAVKAVQALRPLRLVASQQVVRLTSQEPGTPTRLGGQVQDQRGKRIETFGAWLEWYLGALASPNPHWRVLAQGMEIRLCLAPASAEVVWTYSNGTVADVWLPPESELPFAEGMPPTRAARRVLILPLEVLLAIAAAWRDAGGYRRDANLPLSPSGSASASPENENAASPAREAASTRDQSTASNNGGTGNHLPGKVDVRERICKHGCARTGHGSSRPRSDSDDRRTHPAALAAP